MIVVVMKEHLPSFVFTLILMIQYCSESDDGIKISTPLSSPLWQEVRTSMRSLLMRLREKSFTDMDIVDVCLKIKASTSPTLLEKLPSSWI